MNENLRKFQLTPNKPSQKKSDLKLIFFITLLVIVVSVVMGFLVFKDQDQTYAKGEVIVIFNDFDLTEDVIQNFLDEYDLTLTKETVKSFDNFKSLGVIAVKVPRGQEKEYQQILKKSPLVKNVSLSHFMGPL